jgi:hypothetical protein
MFTLIYLDLLVKGFSINYSKNGSTIAINTATAAAPSKIEIAMLISKSIFCLPVFVVSVFTSIRAKNKNTSGF